MRLRWGAEVVALGLGISLQAEKAMARSPLRPPAVDAGERPGSQAQEDSAQDRLLARLGGAVAKQASATAELHGRYGDTELGFAGDLHRRLAWQPLDSTAAEVLRPRRLWQLGDAHLRVQGAALQYAVGSFVPSLGNVLVFYLGPTPQTVFMHHRPPPTGRAPPWNTRPHRLLWGGGASTCVPLGGLQASAQAFIGWDTHVHGGTQVMGATVGLRQGARHTLALQATQITPPAAVAAPVLSPTRRQPWPGRINSRVSPAHAVLPLHPSDPRGTVGASLRLSLGQHARVAVDLGFASPTAAAAQGTFTLQGGTAQAVLWSTQWRQVSPVFAAVYSQARPAARRLRSVLRYEGPQQGASLALQALWTRGRRHGMPRRNASARSLRAAARPPPPQLFLAHAGHITWPRACRLHWQLRVRRTALSTRSLSTAQAECKPGTAWWVAVAPVLRSQLAGRRRLEKAPRHQALLRATVGWQATHALRLQTVAVMPLMLRMGDRSALHFKVLYRLRCAALQAGVSVRLRAKQTATQVWVQMAL